MKTSVVASAYLRRHIAAVNTRVDATRLSHQSSLIPLSNGRLLLPAIGAVSFNGVAQALLRCRAVACLEIEEKDNGRKSEAEARAQEKARDRYYLR